MWWIFLKFQQTYRLLYEKSKLYKYWSVIIFKLLDIHFGKQKVKGLHCGRQKVVAWHLKPLQMRSPPGSRFSPLKCNLLCNRRQQFPMVLWPHRDASNQMSLRGIKQSPAWQLWSFCLKANYKSKIKLVHKIQYPCPRQKCFFLPFHLEIYSSLNEFAP